MPGPKRSVALALFLSGLIWPGTGQLYNRDFKKGAAVILVALTLAGAMFRTLWSQLAGLDPAQLDAAQMAAAAGPALSIEGAALTLVWLYGIVDAYLVARRSG